jgi:hypothetical protein
MLTGAAGESAAEASIHTWRGLCALWDAHASLQSVPSESGSPSSPHSAVKVGVGLVKYRGVQALSTFHLASLQKSATRVPLERSSSSCRGLTAESFSARTSS